MSIRKIDGVVIDADTIDGLNAQLAANQVPVLDAAARLPLANLADAVCSETEADTKVAAAAYKSGSYDGNGTDNRAIPHGLGAIPKVVIINSQSNAFPTYSGFVTEDTNVDLGSAKADVTAWTDTSFYVSTTGINFNKGGITYNWVAFK